ANLNFLAGTKAKESTAYNTALQHFNQAIKILSAQIWTTYYYLGLNLYKERSECEYLSGDFSQSEQTFDLILRQAKSNLDKADVYSIKTVQYANLSRVQEALEVGLEGLKMLGFDLPKEPNQNHLQNALNEIKKMLGNRNPESLLHLTTMTELEKKAAMKLLINLTVPAYYANINLHNLIILQMVIISLKYGNTSETAYAYIMYGAIVQSYHQNYHAAYEFGELGLKLHEKYKNIHLSAKVINQFGVYIAPWKKHLKNVVNIFINAYETGLKVGDLIFTGYAAHNIIIYLILQGEQLREFNIISEKYINFLQRINHEVITYSALLWQHLSLSLQGLTNTKGGLSSDKFDERLFLSKAEDNQFAYALNQYFIIKLQLAFFDEKYPEALEYSLKAEKTLNASHGAIYIVEYYFYSALVIAALYPSFHGENKKNYGKKLQNHQQKLKEWTLNCPENFQHKYFLVSAETARISGQYKQAMDLYNQAISVAKENEYIQIEALANELAAKFYLSNGYELIAKAYMTEARYAYIKWGATTKIKSLEEKYLQFLYKINQGNILMSGGNTNFFTSIAGTGFTLLDLPTVMKASQAIAGEIKLDRLLEKLMNFIIQNAGAQKGFLLLENNGNLFIEAEGSAEGYEVTVLQSIEMDTARAAMLLPVGLINYVARTKQSVVLNNASVDGNFTNDLYINSYLPKSILCTALVNQGKLIGVVYLENSLTTDAFTPDRLELINLLSAQIAISLENAKIYRDLAATNEAYSRFVPKEFLQFLNKQSIVEVKLGDQVQKEMSVLFADIRDFTTLSETMTPEDNFKFINSYLSRMEPVIVANNGFIDKYIGDAIMA
ncbi:MAG TPA: GAF domain-containing protein, partial [Allocoleopsis sp.]